MDGTWPSPRVTELGYSCLSSSRLPLPFPKLGTGRNYTFIVHWPQVEESICCRKCHVFCEISLLHRNAHEAYLDKQMSGLPPGVHLTCMHITLRFIGYCIPRIMVSSSDRHTMYGWADTVHGDLGLQYIRCQATSMQLFCL